LVIVFKFFSPVHRVEALQFFAFCSGDLRPFLLQNRRERISERLRTLQELVPNGTKVDLVTMLEKAISYVKFLQLQVKVPHPHACILYEQFRGRMEVW
jgi:hypothetical protein